MGESSPDSVFASHHLPSSSSSLGQQHHHQQVNVKNHSSSSASFSYDKSDNLYPYMNHHHQQQQQQSSSSSSYDAPFLNLPNQRSASAPLEPNYHHHHHHQMIQDQQQQLRPSTEHLGDVVSSSTSFATTNSLLWGGGGEGSSAGVARAAGGGTILDQVAHAYGGLSLSGREEDDIDDGIMTGPQRGGGYGGRGAIATMQPPIRLHRSTSAFGTSEAELMSHHYPSHRSASLSFLEEERGATAPPPSSRRSDYDEDDLFWSTTTGGGGGATTTASAAMARGTSTSTNNSSGSGHWVDRTGPSGGGSSGHTSRPSVLPIPTVAAVRPAAKTLMELIQEQDSVQSFVTMNQQQQQQQLNNNGTTSMTGGPPGYPAQPEQRWVLESNTAGDNNNHHHHVTHQRQQQQQQLLQKPQPQLLPTTTTTTTMYQLQPRPQQAIVGIPTGDFRIVPAASYGTTTATSLAGPSYVSVMPVHASQQQQQQNHHHQLNHHSAQTLYWQPQEQRHQHHQSSPPSPHYSSARSSSSRGGPPSQRRRASGPPRTGGGGGGGRNSHHHHLQHQQIDYSVSPVAKSSHHHHHHHSNHRHPSTSPPHARHGGNTGPAVGTSSLLLEEFRNSKRSDWTIRLIVGHIVEFCQDQNGSRFIQQRLELGDSIDLVLNEVLPCMHILRVDVFGNYVVQKLLDFGTADMKMEIRNTLEGEMVALSLQMYGCRVVQKALETIPEDQLPTLLSEFHHNVLSLVHDQNGNHVIQKCVEVLNSRAHAAEQNGDVERAEFLWHQVDFIIQDVLVNTKTLSCHPYGCRVFQRMLEHCCEQRKLELLDKIRNAHSTLLDDQYGNYVIQHVLQYGRDEDRNSILSIIQENGLLGLSRQKFASNVVEKLLKYGNSNHRRAVIREMLKKTEDPAVHAQAKRVSIVLLMVRDAYANYVVQTTLDVAPESPEKRALLYELNSHVEELRNYTFAKHIVAKLTSTTSSLSSAGR